MRRKSQGGKIGHQLEGFGNTAIIAIFIKNNLSFFGDYITNVKLLKSVFNILCMTCLSNGIPFYIMIPSNDCICLKRKKKSFLLANQNKINCVMAKSLDLCILIAQRNANKCKDIIIIIKYRLQLNKN